MTRKGPTRAERRRTLAAFLPPDVCDELDRQANSQHVARRTATRPDDVPIVDDRTTAANAIGDEAARHPSEWRQ